MFMELFRLLHSKIGLWLIACVWQISRKVDQSKLFSKLLQTENEFWAKFGQIFKYSGLKMGIKSSITGHNLFRT